MKTYYKIQCRSQDEGWSDWDNVKNTMEKMARKRLKKLTKRGGDPTFNYMFRLVRVQIKETETIIVI